MFDVSARAYLASGQISDISSIEVWVSFESSSGISYQTQLALAASTDFLEGTLKIPKAVFPEDVEPGPDTALFSKRNVSQYPYRGRPNGRPE